MVRNDPATRRLATILGIGVMNATALVAAIGNGQTFSRRRDLSPWLNLVPRQATTGGKPRLLGSPSDAASICVAEKISAS
jgi:transposase